MPPRRPPFNNDPYRPGKARISEIINLKNVDFGANRNNRYMRINTNPTTSTTNNNNTSKLSVRSNSNPPPPLPLSQQRHLAAFKNPLLNSYDHDGDEDYEPQHFVFDFDDDKDIRISKGIQRKSRKDRQQKDDNSGI